MNFAEKRKELVMSNYEELSADMMRGCFFRMRLVFIVS
jgi:hypothetical protein